MAAPPDLSLLELQTVLTRHPHDFDEPESVRFIAEVRRNGLLQDDEWQQVLVWCEEAMRFLADEATDTESDDYAIDADPRNADWIRIVRARRYAGHLISSWAALWLWWIGYERDIDGWWKQIGNLAQQFGYPAFDDTH